MRMSFRQKNCVLTSLVSAAKSNFGTNKPENIGMQPGARCLVVIALMLHADVRMTTAVSFSIQICNVNPVDHWPRALPQCRAVGVTYHVRYWEGNRSPKPVRVAVDEAHEFRLWLNGRPQSGSLIVLTQALVSMKARRRHDQTKAIRFERVSTMADLF